MDEAGETVRAPAEFGVRLAPIYGELRRFASVAGPAEMEPDDLVQEAVVRLLASGRVDDVDDLLAYLRRTVVNVAANERRRLGRHRRALTRAEGSGPLEACYPSDLSYLAVLSGTSRALLYLVDVDGAPIAEAAETLQCSVFAARARLSRARRQLRLSLGDADG